MSINHNSSSLDSLPPPALGDRAASLIVETGTMDSPSFERHRKANGKKYLASVERSKTLAAQQQEQQKRQASSGSSSDTAKASGTTAPTSESLAMSTGSNRSQATATIPVYRQYIYDRCSGNSYVPRNRRKGGADYVKGKPVMVVLEKEKADEDDGLVEEDVTDWKSNRPPHWSCYLPPFVGKFPQYLEQNALCEFVGKWGFHQYFKNHHKMRRRVFFVGFTFNFAALALTTVACMAFTRNYRLLTHTSFAQGEALVPALSNTTKVELNMGFRAIARNDPFGLFGGDKVVTFNNFCDDDYWDGVKDVLDDAICGECQSSSQAFVLSCVFNLFLILRNMFSDITRMYPKYDLNCPNFVGSLFGTVSVFLGLYTIFTYSNRCLSSVDKTVNVNVLFWNDTSKIPADKVDEVEHLMGQDVTIHLEWQGGPGLLCLVAATFFRLIDTLANYFVPTPGITRDLWKQEQYELEYAEKKPETFLTGSSAGVKGFETEEQGLTTEQESALMAFPEEEGGEDDLENNETGPVDERDQEQDNNLSSEEESDTGWEEGEEGNERAGGSFDTAEESEFLPEDERDPSPKNGAGGNDANGSEGYFEQPLEERSVLSEAEENAFLGEMSFLGPMDNHETV